MANFSIKENLLKLTGAFVMNLKGKTSTKRCLIIPIEDAKLFEGKNGVYLNLTGIQLQEARYGETHFVKQSFDKDEYNAMTEEQRNAIPILGGMHEIQSRNSAAPANPEFNSSTVAPAAGADDDLPF